MKQTTKTTFKKAFLNVTAALLAIIMVGNDIALENAAAVNSALGVKTYKIVDAETGGSTEYVRYYTSEFDSIAKLKEAGFEKAKEVEAEGAVLLKNDNHTLPLQGKDITFFGVTSADPVYGGTGSGAVKAEDAPKYYEAFTEAGFNVNKALSDWYAASDYGRVTGAGDNSSGSVITIGEADWSAVKSSGVSFGNGEAAIYVIGRCGGEGRDVSLTGQEDCLNGDYLTLNKEELSVLKGLKELKDSGKISSITVIINSANPISSGFLNDEQYGIDAAVWVGSVGQSGLYAVADIFSGATNPSGRLPDTIWNDNKLNPVLANFGNYVYEGAENYEFTVPARFNTYVVYQEGIYLGYRYTETRYEDVVLGTQNVGNFDYNQVVAYPFGYGLSYTEFEYSDMKVEKSGAGMDTVYTVSVTVTNTGNAAGKETVQVYIQKPYTAYDVENHIEKAAVELVGYNKTKELVPGASETLKIEVPEYFFTSYDAYGEGTYILSAGTHYLTIGKDSHDAVNNILAAKGKTVSDGMTAAGTAALTHEITYEFDAETYSKAYGTGAEVTNLFDFVDINRYEGRGDNSVTYMTRSNWEGTTYLWADADGDGVADKYEHLTMTDQIAADVVLDDADIPSDSAEMQWPVMGSTATALQLIDLRVDSEGNEIAYDDPIWESYLDQLTYAQLSKIVSVGLRMTVGVEEIGKPETLDHNGPSGVTQPYGNGQNGYAAITNDPDKDQTGTCYPCNGIIAATFNDKLVEEVGELIGEDAMWAGYAGIYGTGINIHRSPYLGRVFEYFSEDGILTGLLAAQESKGIQSKGVYVYNKHFALNDQETNRMGVSTWCNEQAMREIYLRAFELPIVNADAKCIMGGMNRVGAIWTSASYELMTSWLRGEAGLSGFVVTDMMNKSTDPYMSKPHEVLAGNDIPDGFPGRQGKDSKPGDVTDEVLISEFKDYGPGEAKESKTMAWAMRTAAHNVLYTVLHSRAMDGITPGSRVVAVTPWWQTALNVATYVMGALTVLAGVFMVLDILKRRKSK